MDQGTVSTEAGLGDRKGEGTKGIKMSPDRYSKSNTWYFIILIMMNLLRILNFNIRIFNPYLAEAAPTPPSDRSWELGLLTKQ
jgi:hypothetical protein